VQQERLVESWLLRKQVEAQIFAAAIHGATVERFEATAGEFAAGGFEVEEL
jgi:hypothetical protein